MCEYCNIDSPKSISVDPCFNMVIAYDELNDNLPIISTTLDFDGHLRTIPIKYCPVCGKEIEVYSKYNDVYEYIETLKDDPDKLIQAIRELNNMQKMKEISTKSSSKKSVNKLISRLNEINSQAPKDKLDGSDVTEWIDPMDEPIKEEIIKEDTPTMEAE